MKLEIPENRKILTLCLIHDDTQILLGLKKRGFGQGNWNGFGGKVQPGETIEEAATREVFEETMLEIKKIEPRGILYFKFDSDVPFLEIHVFRGLEFTGEPQETEEMKPQWFALNAIPYPKMWADDQHWLPLFLQGKNVSGFFHFKDNDTLLEHRVEVDSVS